MTDIIDKAVTLEQQERDRCIERARQPSKSPPREMDGDTIICACCGVPIPPARLRAMPTATLCADCQSLMEARQWNRTT
ncbi:TraR/DksA family transcriptional regulator [Vibrio mediterranei]|uniref:TraR/DksA C4-type zinc finger protein n=1 Tax=Vibrio mediterranei TaxID=689 RepID=UPI001EFEDD68|nr:TraR/DksA family transcriptional regulator [Vibrio mediterranei]MCG9624624.1 TraR/DksA family transcriptional regulator [Vibrio mediterranei]